MKQKLAKFISLLGNPLLTGPVFAIFVLFSREPFLKALWISTLIVGGIFIPLSVNLYRGVKDGKYSNFDVSDQRQRQSWYVWATVPLLLLCIVVFVTQQSQGLRISVGLSLLLMLTAQFVNRIIKSSLHIAVNIFLAFLLLQINTLAGILFFLFIAVIAWSRIILGRHTLKEILAGSVIGLIFGIASLILSNLL